MLDLNLLRFSFVVVVVPRLLHGVWRYGGTVIVVRNLHRPDCQRSYDDHKYCLARALFKVSTRCARI